MVDHWLFLTSDYSGAVRRTPQYREFFVKSLDLTRPPDQCVSIKGTAHKGMKTHFAHSQVVQRRCLGGDDTGGGSEGLLHHHRIVQDHVAARRNLPSTLAGVVELHMERVACTCGLRVAQNGD